jgi:hypothetical protein
MIVLLPDQTPLCPDFVHGAAMCSYCETATKNDEGNLGDNRRRDVLDALSSIELGLTEKEQRAMGKCLAYFDHFNSVEPDI